MLSEGYIGVTKNKEQRITWHKKYSKENPHLRSAIDVHEDVVVDIIFEGERDICLAKENELRPARNIGWNIAIGGGMPPSKSGKKWTKQHRSNYMECITKNNSNFRTKEQRDKMYATREANGFDCKKWLGYNASCTIWWTNGVLNKRSTGQPGPDFKPGRTKFKSYGQTKECPCCGKTGKGSGMVRFHFENCIKYTPETLLQ